MSGPSSEEGEFHDAVTFSSDDESDSSSSSTSTLDGEEYPSFGQLMESVGVQQDAADVVSAEKKQLNKNIEKFGVKKLKYESEMEELVKVANDLTEQENKLKEQRDALNLMKAARLGEARKKVAELKCEISELKGNIEEVKQESKKYNENHKARMKGISHSLIPPAPLFRRAGTAVINYGNYCAEEMEKSYSESEDLTSHD